MKAGKEEEIGMRKAGNERDRGSRNIRREVGF
jgi:hypothetical protein